MLVFTLIIVAELCLLFRVALPTVIAFGERRFSEVYRDPFEHAFGDFPNRDDLNFHDGLISTEAKRHHG